MNLYGADSQEPLAVCSQLTAALNSASSRSSHLANANNNSNTHNGIEAKSTVNSYRTKANIMLNGGMEGVEAEEEEEEEEEETSLGSPVMSSPAHHPEEEHHHPPHHLQELHPSQFPMSGDLPTLDHGMPSPTLGFDLSSCSEHEGTASPPISPNSPSSASYGSSKLDSAHSHPLPTTPSTISPSTNLSSPPLHLHNTIIHSRNILASSPNPLPLPPSFLLPYSQGTDSTSTRGSTGASESSDQLMEEGEEETDKPHVCLWDNCNTEFPSLSSLVAHLDRGHTASMVHYVCLWKDCPREMKPFDARYKLVTHLRCHTGEKPYKCDVHGCTRSFSRLENLKLHVRTHTGEKPYICHYEKCNKRFNNTSDRAKHMKTHITRKPYACKVPGCGKSYTDPSSMRKHVKFAHRMRESHSEGSGTSWSYKSPKKATSPTAIPGSSLLGSTSVVQSPEILFHPGITSGPRISASISPPNRMSVIQSDTPPSSFSPSSTSSSLNPTVQSVLQTQPAMMASTMNASPSPIVPVSVLQVPNSVPSGTQQPTAVATEPQGMQPVLMQVDGTQHKVMLLVPASSAPTTFGGNVVTQPLAAEVNGKGSRHETVNPRNAWQATVPFSKVVSVAPNRPAVLVSPSETSQSRTSSAQQQFLVTSQSQESDLIKQQVHMKIAHLQNQLLTSQQYPQLHTTQPSLSTELVTEQVSRPASVVAAVSPLKETTAARTKAKTLPLHVVPSQQAPQQAGGPVVFSTLGQGLMLHPVQQPQLVNGVLSPQVAQYFQPTSIVQLPNLTSMNVAQSLPHPTAAAAAAAATAQGSASPFAVKPLTVVTPAQVVGVQTLVLPSGQLVSMVPSSTPPHVLIPPVTPSHNSRS